MDPGKEKLKSARLLNTLEAHLQNRIKRKISEIAMRAYMLGKDDLSLKTNECTEAKDPLTQAMTMAFSPWSWCRSKYGVPTLEELSGSIQIIQQEIASISSSVATQRERIEATLRQHPELNFWMEERQRSLALQSKVRKFVITKVALVFLLSKLEKSV